jgi:hypothetical protein
VSEWFQSWAASPGGAQQVVVPCPGRRRASWAAASGGRHTWRVRHGVCRGGWRVAGGRVGRLPAGAGAAEAGLGAHYPQVPGPHTGHGQNIAEGGAPGRCPFCTCCPIKGRVGVHGWGAVFLSTGGSSELREAAQSRHTACSPSPKCTAAEPSRRSQGRLSPLKCQMMLQQMASRASPGRLLSGEGTNERVLTDF